MSVKTDADERLAKARAHIQEAIKELTMVVIQRCDGWDSFIPSAMSAHEDAFTSLLEVRKKLDR